MARTTNEFGGGEIVPAIEAITGIQAPVMADFVNSTSTTGTNPILSAADIVALQAITVITDNGEPRSIQNPKNNLKASSGIERIPFNGIDELDTEYGSDLAATPLFNRTVHALNSGDSRIRFAGSGWNFNSSQSNGLSPGVLRTIIVSDYVEITFFGTALNLLAWTDNTSATSWTAFVDGSTTGIEVYKVTAAVLGSQNYKTNVVLPVVNNLAAGVHTIRIVNTVVSTNGLTLFGCEVINDNVAITQQPGADFDGRVKLLDGTTLPIKPTGFNGTTGARVLNYLTSGGQLKQILTESVEAVVEAGGQGTTYQVQLSTPGTTGTLTIPAGAGTIRVITFGGGTGGSSSGTGRINGFGGGGGARAEVVYTRNSGNTSTLALTSTIGAVGESTTASLAATLVATAGGAGNSNGGSGGNAGAGGTADVPATDPGITGWTRTSTAEFNGNTGGSGGGGAGGAAGGVGGNTGTSVGTITGSIPLFPLTASSEVATFRAEGSGGGQTSTGDPLTSITGAIPGGGGSGETASGPGPGAGARGETYIIYTLATAATPVTNGTHTSAAAQAIGTPREIFGATEHREQEVIRRINFREFGANSQFATLGDTGVDKAFTLDDGTTTLLAGSIVHEATINSIDYMSIGADTGNQSANNFTLTFVGTGLDVLYLVGGANATRSAVRVFVDGFNIGDFDGGDNFTGIMPICSGLAYGTHTVKFQALTSSENDQGVSDFIIYGPKKPEIPILDEGSLELSDYNIMADFVDTPDDTTDTSQLTVGKGTLRKMGIREFIYTNEAVTGPAIDIASISGYQINMENGNVPFFYTFYGTGCEFRFSSRDSKVYQFFVDQPTGSGETAVPLTLTAANFFSRRAADSQTFDIAVSTAGTYGSATTGITANGQVTIANSGTLDNAGFRVTGLPLGVHTFGVLGRTSSLAFRPRCIDVITPIHFQNDNLKVGSEGLNNLTIDPVVEEDEQQVLANLGEAKAWAYINGRTGGGESLILGSHNIAAYILTGTGTYTLFFDKPFKDTNYVALGSPQGGGNRSLDFGAFKSPGASSLEVVNGGTKENNIFSVAFYGQLIDE